MGEKCEGDGSVFGASRFLLLVLKLAAWGRLWFRSWQGPALPSRRMGGDGAEGKASKRRELGALESPG